MKQTKCAVVMLCLPFSGLISAVSWTDTYILIVSQQPVWSCRQSHTDTEKKYRKLHHLDSGTNEAPGVETRETRKEFSRKSQGVRVVLVKWPKIKKMTLSQYLLASFCLQRDHFLIFYNAEYLRQLLKPAKSHFLIKCALKDKVCA